MTRRDKSKPLKRSKVFTIGVWFAWDCFNCGMGNSENADPDVIGDRWFILRCARCGHETRGRLTGEKRIESKKRDRKLARIKQKWEDSLYSAWDKALKRRKRRDR